MAVPSARGMWRPWRRVTIGLSRKTMAPARISGGQMTRTTQTTSPSTAIRAATPTTAQLVDPARRMRSTIGVEPTAGSGMDSGPPI